MNRADGLALAGQGVGVLALGAWAGHAAAPMMKGSAVYGACLLLAALVCGHAAARTLAVTLLAPVAAAQLVQRMRQPQPDPRAQTRGERWLDLGLTLVAVLVFIATALVAGLMMWAWGEGVSLVGALLRFGAASVLLSPLMPRTLRALG